MSEIPQMPRIDLSNIDPEKDQIQISHIEKGADTLPQLNPLSKIGFWLAVIVFSYIAVVTIALLIDYFFHIPEIPILVSADSTGFNNSVIEGYKKLSEISTDRSLKLFDQLIHKTILPVLTSILGYIFGIRGVERQEEENL